MSLIGMAFKLKVDCLGNPRGTVGFVFNQYEDFDYEDEFGVQIIFPNGNYDGFGYNERKHFVEIDGYVPEYSDYEFKNVMRVSRDFQKGLWNWEEYELEKQLLDQNQGNYIPGD